MRISDWSSDVCSSDLHQSDHVAYRRDGRPDGGLARSDRVGGGLARFQPVDAACHFRYGAGRRRIALDGERDPASRAFGARYPPDLSPYALARGPDRKSVVEGKSVSGCRLRWTTDHNKKRKN